MHINNSNIIILSASSGVGKTTVVDAVLRLSPEIQRCVTCTTRKPREKLNEIHGKDYFFLTNTEFTEKIEQQQFLEWSKHYGYCYGTLWKELEKKLNAKCLVLVVDPHGAVALQKKLTHATFVCMLAPSFDVIRQRLESRQTDKPAEINIRLNNYEKEEVLLREHSDAILINHCLTGTVNEFLKIVEQVKNK